MSFAKNIDKNIGKNISKNLSSKYSQKRLDHAKQSATDAIKTAPNRLIQKVAEATGYYKRLQESQKLYQNKMKKKCLQTNIYLQNQDKKLLMI